MALTLTPVEQAGFAKIFETLAQGQPTLSAGPAANALRKSKLPDTVLHAIWGLSDRQGRGYLDREGFYVALKLVALAQAGQPVALEALSAAVPPPEMAELTQGLWNAAPASEWTISPEERKKYDDVFNKLQVSPDGTISGKQARQVLINSKLPTPVLGQIWELADVNKDGKLDANEFAIAMYLVYKALDGRTIPDSLPPGLQIQPSAAAPSAPEPVQQPPPPQPQPVAAPVAPAEPPINQETAKPPETTTSSSTWVVTPAEKTQYDTFFARADADHDGLVTGAEVMGIFLSSKLERPVLAQVWNLCDINKTGKLNAEQFALAMWLIARKVRGVDLPASLPSEMIPPSCRTVTPVQTQAQAAEEVPAPRPRVHTASSQPVTQAPAVQAPVSTASPKLARAKVVEDSSSKDDEELTALRKTRAELEESHKDQQNKLNEARTQLAAVRNECDAERKAIADLQKEFQATATEISKANQEYEAAKAENERLTGEEKRLREALKASKGQLQDLVAAIRAAKEQGLKMQASIDRLTDTKNKVNASLSQYPAFSGSQAAASKPQPASDPFSVKPAADPFAPQQADPFNPRGTQDPFAPSSSGW